MLSLGVMTPLITPVMGTSCPGTFEKDCFDMLKSIGFGHFFQVQDSLIWPILVDLCEIWLGDCLRWKL